MPVTNQTGRIMKKPEEYSKNPNTIRARARKARLDPYTREVEQAKASDSKAVTRAWNIHTRTEAYRDATQTVRKNMLQQVEKEVMDRRRSKGYDASSKIERFMRLNSKSAAVTTSITSTPASRMTGYDSNVTPAPPNFMQPMAQMQPTPLTVHSSNRFATPGPYYSQVMPSVENQRAMTEVSFSQQHLRMRTPQPPTKSPLGLYSPNILHPPNEADVIYEDTTMAYLQTKVNKQEAQIEELKRTIQGLVDDLTLAKSTICSQVARMNQLAEGVQFYYNTASGQVAPEVEFGRQASRLQNIASGIQKITGMVTEVCNSIANGDVNNSGARTPSDNMVNECQDGIASNMEGTKAVNTIKDNEKQIIPDHEDTVNRFAAGKWSLHNP